MPHTLLTDFKSILPQISALKLGQLKAMVIVYANAEVNRIYEELKQTCPPQEVLVVLNRQVTQVRTAINTVNKNVSTLNRIPPTLDPAIKAATVIAEVLSHLAIPSTAGLPPPNGGVIRSVSISKIQANANKLVWVRKMKETLENDKKAITGMIGSFNGVFTPVETKLAIIEGLIARCMKNPNMSIKERKALLDGINADRVASGKTGKADASAAQGGESYTNSKGTSYTLSIVTEKDFTTVIPRRKAIAKDFRDIVVLQGPFSFAGDDQVLLDELKFRIDNQLP